MTVLPVMLRSMQAVNMNAEQSERLAAGMRDQQLAQVTRRDAPAELSAGWNKGHSGMWKRSAREFRNWMSSHPAATDYALMAEYLMGTRMVGGVHVYVVDRQGRLAYGRMLGPEDPLYVEMVPIGPDDCTTLVLAALRQDQRRVASMTAMGDKGSP